MPRRRLTADEIASAVAAIHRRLNLGPGDRVILAEMTDEDGNPVVLEVILEEDPEDEPQGPRGP